MSTIPRCIEVVRDSTGVAQVTIDGEPFPYALSAADGVTVPVTSGNVPTVRLSLVAHSVLVSDELLADEDLNAAHDHEAAEA